MASVRQRGETYQIRVNLGYNGDKRIVKTMTWKPNPEWSKKRVETELNRQVVLFEEKCKNGQFLDNTTKLSEFIDIWIDKYASKQLREKSFVGYMDLLPRIKAALGHIHLSQLQPHQILEFYENLGEDGIRLDTKYAPIVDFRQLLKDNNLTQKEFAKIADTSINSVASCVRGNNVAHSTAQKIASALQTDIKALFAPVESSKGLSANTKAKYHRILSSILTTAVQWQIIPSNPCERVKPPQIEYKEMSMLDENQTSQLIECLNDEPTKYKTAIMLILYTGLRRGELCALTWNDIDFEKGLVDVNKSLLYTPRQGVFEDTTKTRGSKRVIKIPPAMIDLLKYYKDEQDHMKSLLGDQWENSNRVFVSDIGGNMHPDTLSHWYKKFIKRHNLPESHIHTLRHVSATLLIAGGTDIVTVAKRLGHSTSTTTLNIYAHAIRSADAAASEELQNVLSPDKNYKQGKKNSE